MKIHGTISVLLKIKLFKQMESYNNQQQMINQSSDSSMVGSEPFNQSSASIDYMRDSLIVTNQMGGESLNSGSSAPLVFVFG